RSSWRRGRGATSRSVARSTSARSTSWPTTCPPFPSCTRNPSGWSRAACEGSASTRRVACAASRRPGGCSEPGAAQDREHPARRGRSAAPRLGLPRPRPRRSGGRDPRRASDGGRPGGAPQGAAPRPQRLGPDGVFRARRARPGSPQLGSPVSGPSLRPHRAGLSSHGPPRADLAGLRADDRPSARSRRRAPPPHRRRHARQRLCRAGSGAAAHLDRSALHSRLRHPPGLVARFGIRVGQEPGAAHGDAGAGAGRIPRPHDPRLASRHAGRGLRAHGAGQGAAPDAGALPPRLPQRALARAHRRWTAARSAARWSGGNGEGLRLSRDGKPAAPGDRPARLQHGPRLRPRLHLLLPSRQPPDRPRLPGGRPEDEGAKLSAELPLPLTEETEIQPRRRPLVEGLGPRIGLAIVAVLVLVAILAPWLSPHDPREVALDRELLPPSAAHPLGTAENGVDVLSHVLWGARISLSVGVLATLISAVVGTLLGAWAGMVGGLVDEALMRVVDVLLAFPGILLAIFITAVLGPSLANVILALCATGWTGYARLARAMVLSLREREFVL